MAGPTPGFSSFSRECDVANALLLQGSIQTSLCRDRSSTALPRLQYQLPVSHSLWSWLSRKIKALYAPKKNLQSSALGAQTEECSLGKIQKAAIKHPAAAKRSRPSLMETSLEPEKPVCDRGGKFHKGRKAGIYVKKLGSPS